MDEETDHEAAVDAWMQGAAQGRSVGEALDAFELAFGRLWARAHVTLGDVTLGDAGLSCSALRERSSELPLDELSAGLRFVLLELLTVLGSLTAEILSPALHAELRLTTRARETPAEAPTPDRKGREDEEP